MDGKAGSVSDGNHSGPLSISGKGLGKMALPGVALRTQCCIYGGLICGLDA